MKEFFAIISKRVPAIGFCLAPLCILFFATACDTSLSPQANSAIDAKSLGQRASLSNSASQASELDWRALLEELPNLEKQALLPVAIPEDIQSHPQSLGESFELRWSLLTESNKAFSVYSQLDRLKVKDDLNTASLWSFNSVARASVALGNSDSPAIEQREDFARVALGLAESGGHQFTVGATLVKFGEGDSCKRAIYFSHHGESDSAIELTAEPAKCPLSASLGTINQWEFDGILAKGSIAGEEVEGFLWLTHRWGNGANSESPVVLDQLRIVTRDANGNQQWLSITRSKRRSGRGPKTVLATVRDAAGNERGALVEWVDEAALESSVTGISYPKSIRIKELSMKLDMTLTPVVAMSELRDSLQTRWSGALTISGTHTGLAYLDFLPITPTSQPTKN